MTEQFLYNDIITEHRERMLNLKKYYPFFKLSEVSFSWYKEGMYDCLDMGYILMAVLRFFIEENNFKEQDVTYKEYSSFMANCIRRDFGINPPSEDLAVLTDYIFGKLKNDGKPFIFTYFDPVDKKKKVSRIRLLESRIVDGTVWYSISPEGIEFYLDTKEIRDESKISVEQLLLEKMIRSKDFKGGADVVRRINNEVDRLYVKKNQVMSLLSTDVHSGLEAYEEFFSTGIKWFSDEQKLFKKNSEAIEAALAKAKNDGTEESSASYMRTAGEIYKLDTELKVAMNNHARLLAACTELGIMADEMVKKAKLSRLRPRFDFRTTLDKMIKADDATLLFSMVRPLLGINLKKTMPLVRIEDLLTFKGEAEEKAEKISNEEVADIVFEDELEDERIRENYRTLMYILLKKLKASTSITLKQFNSEIESIFGRELFSNGDYYSFLIHLCQKKLYRISTGKAGEETFLDDMICEYAKDKEFSDFVDMQFELRLSDGNEENLVLSGENESDTFEVTNFTVSVIE